jgi:hypothetical protein
MPGTYAPIRAALNDRLSAIRTSAHATKDVKELHYHLGQANELMVCLGHLGGDGTKVMDRAADIIEGIKYRIVWHGRKGELALAIEYLKGGALGKADAIAAKLPAAEKAEFDATRTDYLNPKK